MKIAPAVVGCVLLALAQPARAGGYDTPILYSARHMGMGGTAISFVDDPSALFHNPAGLSHTKFISLTADFSPLFGNIQGSPQDKARSVKSETTFAPFFIIAGGFRVTDWLTLGVGAYPVASAGAEYKYSVDDGVNTTEDRTKLVFIEIPVAASFEIPHSGVSIGLAYRMSMVSLDRYRKATDDLAPFYDMELKGFNAMGFRAGVQWQPIPELRVGLVYRHKTETEVTDDSARFLGNDATDVKMKFTLPSKLGFGVRGDLGPVGLAVDGEWGFHSQNEESNIEFKIAGAPGTPVANKFHWKDALTLRTGVEYRFLDAWAGRLGYIFDQQTSNEHYPTAFGTPPGPTHSLTAGVGYKAVRWEANLAYAYRFGTATVTEADVNSNSKTGGDPANYCAPCAKAGDYEIKLNGVYADFSWYFE